MRGARSYDVTVDDYPGFDLSDEKPDLDLSDVYSNAYNLQKKFIYIKCTF